MKVKREKIILKGNHKSTNRCLDRLIQFDERSRNYPISQLRETSKKIRSYTWRCFENYDQGNVGACVAYSVGHELNARPSEVTGITDKFLIEDIYWEAQKIDPWEGGEYPGANPKYAGTSVLAGVKIAKKLGYCQEYRWAFKFEDLLYGLGHNGPAILGLDWTYGMFFPDENGFIQPRGYYAGGHAVIARAINIREEFVTIRNSWGKNWGKDGDCFIRFWDLEQLLKRNGEACFLIKRTINPSIK